MSIDVIHAPLVEPSVQNVGRDRGQALSVAAMVIVFFALWLGMEAPHGTMCGTDELLTAERTREMLMTGRWVVHYNFHRSFEKPPLQYWLTSLTLPRFQNRALAVRVWPLFYGILTAAALAWLVLLIEPNRPWLVPLSLAILVSAPLFSTECARGLLDVGLALFTTLTIIFTELARKKPVWWIGVALACGLSSLQKFPLPFLIWVLIVLVRLTSRDERAELRKGMGWLAGSMLLAIALMSIWTLLQIRDYGMSLNLFYHDEILVWLGPQYLGGKPYFEIPIAMSLEGGLCGFLSLIGLFVILFSKRERESRTAWELAWVTLAFLLLLIVSNFRHVRYAIPVVPVLCFLLAFVFYRFLRGAPPVRKRATVALFVLLAAGFIHAGIHIHLRRRDVDDEKAVAEKLGQLQQGGTETVLIKAIVPGNDLLWDSFYLFHGNLQFPVTKLTTDEIRRQQPKPPLIGASIARDFPVVQELYPNVEVELTRAQFICWRVPRQ